MSLVPTGDGVVGMVAKAVDASPSEAQMLIELGLFEAMSDLGEANREGVQKMLTEVALADLVRADKQARAIAKADIEAGREVDPSIFDTLEEIAQALVEFGKDEQWDESEVNRDAKGRFARKTVRLSRSSDPQRVAGDLRRAKDERVRDEDTFNWQTRGGERVMRRRDVADPNLKGRKDQAAMFDVMRMATDPASAARLSRALSDRDGRLDTKALAGAARDVTRESEPGDRRIYRQMETLGAAARQMTAPGSSANLVAAFAEMTGKLGPEAEEILGPGIRRTAYRYRGVERRPDKNLSDYNKLTAQTLDNVLGKLEKPAAKPPVLPENATPSQLAQYKREVEQTKNPGPPDRLSAREIAGRATAAASQMGIAHNPEVKVILGALDKGGTPDQMALRAQGDTVVAAMTGALPGTSSVLATMPELQLSIEADDLPPSHGVIINADGRMVTQAHGHRGDHYLPFNLRNLKALQGGQYVRTRALGGPSTEDVYTGLMTGARQIQVVSNSGVYTVEFDPDLRGVRRYSDKARQMITRYEKMLGAINNNTDGRLMERDISPEVMEELRAEAWQASGGDAERFKANVKAKKQQYLLEASAGVKDGKSAITRAKQHAENELKNNPAYANLSNAAYADTRRDLITEYMDQVEEETPKPLELNGEGYHRALKALAQEFPYFIRSVDYTPLRDWTAERGLPTKGLPAAGLRRAKDSGYKSRAGVDAMLREGLARRRSQPTEGESQQTPAAASSGATPGAAAGQASSASATQNKARAEQAEKTRAGVVHAIRNKLRTDAIKELRLIEEASLPSPEEVRSGSIQLDWGEMLHFKIRQAPTGSQALEILADELVKATPDQRAKFDRYLKGEYIAANVDGDPEEKLYRPIREAVELAQALSPFRTDTADDLAEPDPTSPAPPKVAGVPDPLSSPADDVLAAAESMAMQHPAVYQALEEMKKSKVNPALVIEGIYNENDGELDEAAKERVRAYNTAWALQAAVRSARKFEMAMPSKEAGGPPKELGPQPGLPGEARKSLRRAPWQPPREVAKAYRRDLNERMRQILG